MANGSGLASQVGFAQESTVGTYVTPDHFPYFDSESVNWDKNTLISDQLGGGAQFNLAPNRVVSTVTANGDVTMDHAYNKMGIFWKNALGGTSGPTIVTGTAYKTIITPADLTGVSMSYQKGVPQTDGTVRPFSFNGIKTTALKFSVTDGQIAQIVPTLDGWTVATATALTASSPPAQVGVFDFANVSAIKLGGTATTASGVTSISGGVALTTLVNSFDTTITNPMKVDRYGLGNLGIKREQIINGKRLITGTLGGEFTQRTELWDLFNADATTCLQVTFTGPQIASTGSFYTLDLIYTALKFDTGDLSIGGPDVVPLSLDFSGYLDGGGSNPAMQVTLTNTDTTF